MLQSLSIPTIPAIKGLGMPSETNFPSKQTASGDLKPPASRDPLMLTRFEIEQLRRRSAETGAYAKWVFQCQPSLVSEAS